MPVFENKTSQIICCRCGVEGFGGLVQSKFCVWPLPAEAKGRSLAGLLGEEWAG